MRTLGADGARRLLAELARRGYDLVGPVRSEGGAVVFDRIGGVEDLAAGVIDEQAPGSYRLTEGAGPVLFGTTCGPDSAKRHLFPPREEVATVRRDEGRLAVEEPAPDARPTAIVGLRSCDLHAVAVQDRVFLSGPYPDGRYRARREAAFLVGVDCGRAGATCFCSSMGTGPACSVGFDVALTELPGQGFLARAGTPAGAEVLDALGAGEASAEEVAAGAAVVAAAEASMGRTVEAEGLRELLPRNAEHPRWQAVAEACLACGNCTAVCPTCFCHDEVDRTPLGLAGPDGAVATRSRQWASCFSLEFSHLSAFDVRESRSSRYRQWLTHKFAGWFEQFGTSGCVGCGRCITWCPVGIDVTAELAAIRATDGERATPGGDGP